MKRLLAIILASLLILSSATAGASAYQAYKDDALTKYDFTDTAVLTTEQYASALLDYADKALAKENITMDLSILGKLDATSIDNALSSVYKLINGNKIILWMAGDLNSVNVDAIKNPRRSNTTDVAVIKALLQFLADNKGIVKKVVVGGVGKYKRDGGVSLGVANSFVKVDLNVEVMLREMIWGLAYPNTEYNSSNNIDSMLQVIIQNALAGVKEIPDSVKNLVDLNSTKSTYDFIEDLLQTAYNDIAVPMLNDQTMKWLGQEIDKDTTGTLAGLFNRDFRVSAYTVPAGSTLVAELNNIAGGIVNGLLKNYNGWVSGDNSKLTDNVVAVARYILKETGDYFFPDWQKHIATAEEIDAMSKEELIAYLARSIINASVGYMYIPEDVTTVVGVAWEAVKQLMAQFLPERDYSGYPKTVQGILDMLADFVAYNVNPGIDLNAGDLKKALNYGDGMDKMLTTAVQWLAADPQYYTGLLPSTTIDTSDGWKALDDIFFKLLDKSVLPAKFANSGSETILKDIVYSILNGLLVDQDLTCISDLFVKNESGAFATQTLKQSIVRLVTDILNAVLPGTITKTYGSLNEIVSNSELGSIVENLLGSLNSNKDKLVPPIVNIVAQVMKLTDKAKFKEMEIAGSKRIKNSSELDLTVYNGSQGINRGYTDKNNNFTQDKLPRYTIDSWSAVAYNYDGSKQKDLSVSGLTANEELNGGDNRSVKISGIDSNNTLVVFTVYYFALDEAGNKLTNDASVCRFYSYRLDGADVDNNTSGINTGSNKTSASVNDCPPKLLLFNQNNTNPLKTICAQSVTFKVPKGKGAHTGSNASANLGGLSSNLKSATSSASMDGGNAISGSNAYDSIDLWEETASIAKFEVGFDTTINWAATAKKGNKTDHYNGATRIICYNDYGLPELYNIEAGKNRARTDYDSSADAAWDAYITALNNAAIYTLLPGTIALYTNSEFLAGFEARQKALASAVETLETHLVSASVDSLKTAVEAVQGKDNAEGAVYWDDGYNYFGYDDFNSVTWNGWKEARNRALNLYNSTIAPKEPVAPEKPGDDATLIEKQKYEKAYAQWETDHAAWETAIVAWQTPTISAIDVAYAEQQVELWGPRLIKLAAVKTHLDAAIKMCTIDSADASKYDADRWEAYAKSFAYAQKVSTSFNASTTMRTQVREAMNNLIYNWKRLIANPVVTVTFTFTVNGETHAVLTGNQGDPVDLSSIEAPAAPVGMHFVGWGNVPATFDADATFEAQFANNTDTKYTVNVYNMDTTGNYPATPDSTYQGAGETNSTADITADAVAAEGFSLDSAKSTLTGTIAADGSLVLSIYYSRNQYTITYANTDLEPDTYYYGATVSARTPEKAGYAFQGWEEEVPSTMPAQNITLTAKWNENPADYTDYDIAVAAANAKKAEANYDKTYTEASRKALDAALAVDVSGKKLSEQGVVDAQTAAINAAVKGLEKMTYNATFYVDGEEYRVVPTKVGEQIVAPEAPSKQGYTFTGWTPEVGTMGIEDVSFNAVFSAGTVAYTVETYVMDVNGNYGDAAIENKSATTGETVSVTPEAREGFSVAAESVLSGEVKADGSLVLKVYYSRNQYKLTVDGNVTNVYYGAAISVSEPAAREGYTFAGWDRDVPETMPASDVTLVSQWNENDADYTAYNAAKAAAEAKQAEANFDKTYTAESRQALADALAKDVSGKKYTQQGEVDAAAKAINDAVTALELMTYKATFYVDGAEYKVVTAKVGEAIAKPDDPSKTGYVFTGWDPEVGTMGTEDVSFNAKFSAGEVSYTVETYVMGLDGQYGAADSKNVAATTGAEITLTPDAREGFTVAGESVLTGTVAADSSLVLKVYYSRNQYKLTVDGTTTEVYYGAALEIADPEARTGYTFAGWKPAAPATMPANDVTLESQWTEDGADYTAYDAAVKVAQAKQAESDYAARYTEESRNALAAALAADVSGKKYTQQGEVDAAAKAINDAVTALELMTYKATFYVDGAEYKVVTAKVGEAIAKPDDPSKTGYVFTGWDPEVGTMGTEDVSFNAKFSAGEVSYTVETYVMGLDGQYGAADSKNVAATTGAEITLTPDAREGFTVAGESVLTGTVAADSSLVLKVYYSRNQYKLTVDGTTTEVYYGAALEIADPEARTGYTFAGWKPAAPATMPANDVTLESQWTEDGADYTAYDAAVKVAQAKQAESDYAARYTEESRNALAAALAADVSGKKYTQQGEVDAATTAINNAVAGLDKMTYNAIFTVDGEEYAKVPTKVDDQIVAPKDPSKEGYTFAGWKPSVGIMGTADATFEAVFAAAGDTAYTVNTYVMGTDGTYGDPTSDKLTGTTGSTATYAPEAREGFTVADESVLSGTIAADGSLVLKVYYSRNKYTLTVDGVASEVYYGAAVSVAEPSKEHYTFAGWEPELPDTMPANDVTVVSKWTEDGADYTAYDAAVAAAQAKKAETDYDKTYTAESRAALDAALAEKVSGKKYSEQSVVDAAAKAINDAVASLEVMTYNATFYVDGAEYRVVPTKVGAQIVAPEAPSKTGYVFTGWDPAVGVMGTEDVSFNAQFSAGEVSYKVETYVMGLDGQYGAAETKTVPATTGAAVSVEPEAREGFTVADNSVLSGVVVADSSLVLKVYYSRNQYKLSVDGVESDVYYGAALNIAAPAAREGFTFTGWNVEVPANMPASDLTLVSQWSENDADYTAYNAAVAAAKAKQGEENYDKMYTAETRDALAGALAIDVAGKKYSEQSVVDAATKAINDAVAALEVMTYNAIFTVDGAQYEVVPTKVGEQIVAPKDPAKEGYVFKGWDKEVGKMGVEDITFAAQFEEASGIAYTVEVYTMDVNGNYGAAETKTLYGTTDAEVTADTTAAEGFTFDESAANVVSGTVAADGSLVLKVYFARNQYKLTVDGAESEVYYGAALDIATPAAREGYTFTGWNVDVPATMPASDLTLVSQWSENDADYTAYNAAVAAAQAKKAETDYDKTYTAESRAALDAALAEKVSGKKYSEQSVVDAAAKAINDAVASLEVMTYNATFYVDGAEYRVVPTKVGEQIIAPENPTKEGFVFTGWDKEVGVMGTEDVSFNAQFSAGEVSYKVETYVMDVNGAYGAADVKVVPATTGAAVSVDPEAREGFTVAADSVLSGTVAADGSLVLKVYYSRNQYKLTVDGAESMVYYGAELNIAEPTKDHYTFAGWNVEVPATMPASDLTLVSQWTEEGADYTAYDAAVKAAQAKKAEADYDKTYTAESRAALDAALAIDVANKKYSEQADVDAATAAINDAVKALELMTYTANFYVNGQLYKAVTAKVGEQIIAPKDPSVDGYNFNGWDPAVGTMGTEDVRFDAILVASNSSIISVTPETPNYGGMHQYAVKVKGEPLKIKIVDANGNTRTFDRNTSMTSDANALGILKIEKTEDGEIWLINANLAEGKFTAYAKMAKEYWENDGYGFTVSFDQKPEPKIGDVTEVTYDTPNYGGKQDYRVKVTDKAGKIQFVYANGGTTTLTRLDPRVSIKSYDAQGNEVYANSTNLAYEIWTVNFNLPAGNYVVRAKYGRNTWSEGLAVNVVISAKPATAVSVTEVNASADSVAVTVNGTAKKVKITYASGATRTFNRDDANVSIASNGDGEIWTINVKLTEGDYTATAKYIDNGKQVWDTTDFAFTV